MTSYQKTKTLKEAWKWANYYIEQALFYEYGKSLEEVESFSRELEDFTTRITNRWLKGAVITQEHKYKIKRMEDKLIEAKLSIADRIRLLRRDKELLKKAAELDLPNYDLREENVDFPELDLPPSNYKDSVLDMHKDDKYAPIRVRQKGSRSK